MFSAASLVSHMLDASDNLIETGLKSLETIHDMLLNNGFPNENIVHEQAVDQLTKILDDLAEELTLKRRTGKLWIEYVNMIRLVLLFIRAERTADRTLHLFCISKMMPILHAGGHTAYAKSTRLYLQQMHYTIVWTRNNTCLAHGRGNNLGTQAKLV